MIQDRKRIKKEEKRLMSIRDIRNRRNESKHKSDINYPKFKKRLGIKKINYGQ